MDLPRAPPAAAAIAVLWALRGRIGRAPVAGLLYFTLRPTGSSPAHPATGGRTRGRPAGRSPAPHAAIHGVRSNGGCGTGDRARRGHVAAREHVPRMAHDNLGVLLFDRGELAEADEHFREVVRRAPSTNGRWRCSPASRPRTPISATSTSATRPHGGPRAWTRGDPRRANERRVGARPPPAGADYFAPPFFFLAGGAVSAAFGRSATLYILNDPCISIGSGNGALAIMARVCLPVIRFPLISSAP